MSRKVECDRCRKNFKESQWNGQIVQASAGWEAELCGKCISNLKDWVTNYVDVAEG